MGTTFQNFQVFCRDQAAVEALCPNYTVRSLMPNWVTVADRSLRFDLGLREARRLSRALPYPVLLVHCFDEDFVDVSIYRNGKRIARHAPAEHPSARKNQSNAAIFAECFALSAEEEESLRLVFQEENPEAVLHLIACVLNCVLWVDADWIDSAALPDRSYLTEYLERVQAVEKLKNRTKLTLKDTMPGMFGWSVGHPVVQYENENWAEQTCWIAEADGHFKKLYGINLPGQVLRNARVVQKDDLLGVTVEGWQESAFHVLRMDGTILYSRTYPGTQPANPCILDECHVFNKGCCTDFYTGEMVWDLQLTPQGGIAYVYGAPVETEEGCYVCTYQLVQNYMTKEEIVTDHLLVFDRNGSVRGRVELPETEHWRTPVCRDGKIWLLNRIERGKYVLSCYDTELRKLSERETEEVRMPWFDEAQGRCYVESGRYALIAADLKTGAVCARRRLEGGANGFVIGVLPGVGPVLQYGGSTIEVLDASLQTISRHRTKGESVQMLQIEGHTFLLTHQYDESRWNGGCRLRDSEGAVRLYELK